MEIKTDLACQLFSKPGLPRPTILPHHSPYPTQQGDRPPGIRLLTLKQPEKGEVRLSLHSAGKWAVLSVDLNLYSD